MPTVPPIDQYVTTFSPHLFCALQLPRLKCNVMDPLVSSSSSSVVFGVLELCAPFGQLACDHDGRGVRVIELVCMLDGTEQRPGVFYY